jgi:hypothetical protein
MKNKKAQQTMSMPFGMIFAIFLIIVFVVFAFMAIGGFLDIGKSADVGMFYTELQEVVNDAMRGQSSESTFKINLPSKIKQICFANLSIRITNPGPEHDAIKNYEVYNANTFLLPPEYASNMQWKIIEHINVTKITATKNPYCVNVRDDLIIKKGFYDRQVTIE